jgi:hypothetical protein
MVIDEETGRMVFTYAWLYFITRTFEIPMGNITQYKVTGFKHRPMRLWQLINFYRYYNSFVSGSHKNCRNPWLLLSLISRKEYIF